MAALSLDGRRTRPLVSTHNSRSVRPHCRDALSGAIHPFSVSGVAQRHARADYMRDFRVRFSSEVPARPPARREYSVTLPPALAIPLRVGTKGRSHAASISAVLTEYPRRFFPSGRFRDALRKAFGVSSVRDGPISVGCCVPGEDLVRTW